MALFWLIHEWFLRLGEVRRQLAEDARGGQLWMVRIRARILGFLISRYSDRPADQFDSGERAAARERQTFCIVALEEHPPRRCAELRGRLANIRAINAAKRPRWRWFL